MTSPGYRRWPVPSRPRWPGWNRGDASTFAAGLAAFDASLRPIEAVIGRIRRRYPGAPVAYTERVPGYLLAAAASGC